MPVFLFQKHSVVLTATAAVLFLVTGSAAFASGGVGGGFGRSSAPAPQRVVDESYEFGKAVFKGRAGAPKQRYCVNGDEKPVKVKRSSLKPFRGTSVRALADALVLCDMGDTSALAALSDDQSIHLIYYLNKRFKLQLAGV
ncbi:MAG: hypothetical protein AAGC71_11925 [Pseudomonadota bacterium]